MALAIAAAMPPRAATAQDRVTRLPYVGEADVGEADAGGADADAAKLGAVLDFASNRATAAAMADTPFGTGLTATAELPDELGSPASVVSSASPIAPNADWQEIERLARDQAWRIGAFRLTPYGALWADMVFASQRTNPGAYTLYVFSPQEQGESAFAIDVRRTRLGMNLAGPGLEWLPNSTSRGRVEIDFHGNFVTENRAGVLLRHAYWELLNDQSRLLVGQTNDVISPLSPAMVNYSNSWNAGNIGFRRAQFRAERYWQPSDDWRIGLEGSLNQDVVSDFSSDAGIRRESTQWPVIESRVSTKRVSGELDARRVEFGLSGHIGQTGFDFLTSGPPPALLPPEDDARFLSWSVNADFQFPLTQRLAVQGEFFHGANLGSYLGGIGQGVCPCSRVPIRSTGGWIELAYDWSPRWHYHCGYGVDDPLNRDSLIGRVYNQVLFANVIHDITAQWTTGFEIGVWTTHYHDERNGQIPDEQLLPTEAGRAVTLDWMIRFGF